MRYFSEDSRGYFALCEIARLDHTFATLVNFFYNLLITGSETDAVIQQIHQRLPVPALQNTEAIWHQRANNCATV